MGRILRADDISDCRHPVLKGQVNASSTSFHHIGNFAPDGKTFYATQNFRGVGGFLLTSSTSPTRPIRSRSRPGNTWAMADLTR